MGRVKAGGGFISKILAKGISTSIGEGTEVVMKGIEDQIMHTEKRILQEIFSLLIMGFGGLFLIFALFFYLKESLGWSNAAAFFSIGITISAIGLLLKIWRYEKH